MIERGDDTRTRPEMIEVSQEVRKKRDSETKERVK